jgi:hypothetical protein
MRWQADERLCDIGFARSPDTPSGDPEPPLRPFFRAAAPEAGGAASDARTFVIGLRGEFFT